MTGVLWVESRAQRGGNWINMRRWKDYDEEVKGLWWGETGLDKFKVGMLQLPNKEEKQKSKQEALSA